MTSAILEAEEVIDTTTHLATGHHTLTPEIRAELLPLLAKSPTGAAAYSQEQIAKEAGLSASTLSKTLNGTYAGDIAAVETAIATWLARRELRIGTTHALFPTEVTTAMEATFKIALATNDFVIITGPGGIGKSMGCALYCQKQGRSVLAISLYKWTGRATGIARALRDALVKRRLRRDQTIVDDLLKRLTGSQRLIIIDGAERITEGGIHFLIDLHKRTGCPIALVGREEVTDLLTTEMGHIGLTKKVSLADDDKLRKTVRELVRQIAPDWTDHILHHAVALALKHRSIGFLPKQIALMRELYSRAGGDLGLLFAQTQTLLHCCK